MVKVPWFPTRAFRFREHNLRTYAIFFSLGAELESRIWDGRCRESVISLYGLIRAGFPSSSLQLSWAAANASCIRHKSLKSSVARLPWLPALLFPLLSSSFLLVDLLWKSFTGEFSKVFYVY
jgi:hypothetical protein